LIATLILSPMVLLLAASAEASAGPTAIHPPVHLLDRDGGNVRDSGKPVSTMKTCAGCHDTAYIATHSFHVSLGRDERFAAGTIPCRRPWDYSPGAFGRWNPLDYRYLSPPGDRKLDLSVAGWLQTLGRRHVGGGPAWSGHGDTPLVQRSGGGDVDPDSHLLDGNGRTVPWDWSVSGAVEMNCFLCHVKGPDNRARVEQLDSGRFDWANTATLYGRGIVEETPEGWIYRPDAFRPDGAVEAARLGLRSAVSENCGLCHGQVHFGDQPLELDLSLHQWSTATKGQVFSPQRISQSAVNLRDKSDLSRPWDIHAERLLDCTSCHYSINSPADYEPTRQTRPAHLRYEPRRLTMAEYLYRPNHQLAKGHTSQGGNARHLDGTMRGCADCHDAKSAHTWLPYLEAHLNRLSCEACHIAQVHAPAVRQADWTLLSPVGEPRIAWRSIEGEPKDPSAAVTGFRPVLLPRQDLDGRERLAPHNLVTSWYWVENGPQPRPVRLADLKAALLGPHGYHPEMAAALDADGDGVVSEGEAVLDLPEKVEAVRRRLVAVGVQNPQMVAEIQPYGIHHGVGPADTATRRCETCHTDNSRLTEPFTLALAVPGSVAPKLVGDSVVRLAGNVRPAPGGRWDYVPSTRDASLYVLGHDRWRWVNWLGGMALAGVFGGVALHGLARVRAARQRSRRDRVASTATQN